MWRRVILALGLVALLATPSAAALRLATIGDTGLDGTTRAVVAQGVAAGAQGAIGLGDYGHGADLDDALALLAPLFSKGAYLAVGNHDSTSELRARGLLPMGATWSRSLGGVRVVTADSTQTLARGSTEHQQVRDMLCGASESLKVLVVHTSWWLLAGARHPGSEFRGSPADMDALVRDCGVDLVLSGHEHNYQRLARGGAWYVIAPPANWEVRAVLGSPSGTVASCSCAGLLVLDLASGSLSARMLDASGRQRDAFTVGSAPGTAPPPATGAAGIAFSASTGNEWWVQVKVGGADAGRVTRVEAMDTGGAWTALTWRSWGWAGSFHVEPGHLVQYRATLSDGRVATSCLYTHPAGVCAGGAPAPSSFDATFRNVRGNEWWIESDVSAVGGTLAGVDARVNGGAWTALVHQSWGSWARSIHAAPGSTVELRARATSGATDVSAACAWPPR